MSRLKQTPETNLIRQLSLLIGGLALLSGIFGFGSLFYYWDPTRVVIKRNVKSDPYVYEEINPRLLAIDFEGAISIRKPADVEATRARVVNAIWGGARLPSQKQPSLVTENFERTGGGDCQRYPDKRPLARRLDCSLGLYGGMDNLAGIDRIEASIYLGYKPVMAHFRPKKGNGRLVIYHHGFAGTYHEQSGHIRRLVARGYAVLANNLMAYGGNLSGDPQRAREHRLNAEFPMRFFIEPLIVGVNYGIKKFAYSSIDMLGFSAGGYVVQVAAAVDKRVRRSYVVGSPYPMLLRDSPKSGPDMTRVSSMLKASNYLELYILGSLGTNRRQMHIYNRFDRCCWRNTEGKLFESPVREAVKRLGPGDFRVMIDESHARHKVSSFALEAILKDMEAQ